MATQLQYLTVDNLKTYLRITDTIDDQVLADIVAAAMQQQYARCITAMDAMTAAPDQQPLPVPPAVLSTVPPDLFEAALMRGARLYARRASPEGLIPLGDLGVARVPRFDADIDALEAPYRDVVIA